MKEIKLSELSADVGLVRWGSSGPVYTTLQFDCPLCDGRLGHRHLVPFVPGDRKGSRDPVVGHVWGHISGDSIDDLTLDPSYLAIAACRLHAFIRNGVLEVLSDSRAPEPGEPE